MHPRHKILPTIFTSINIQYTTDYALMTEPLYRYKILERVIVENITPGNVIINQGASEG